MLEAGAVTSPSVGDGEASNATRGVMRCCVLGRSGAWGEEAKVGDIFRSKGKNSRLLGDQVGFRKVLLCFGMEERLIQQLGFPANML